MIQSSKRNSYLFLIFLLTVLLLGLQTNYSHAQKVTIDRVPDWVNLQVPDYNCVVKNSDVSGGSFYLLVDYQENIAEQSIYCRYVVKLINNQGVQNLSDISVNFDPTYQQLFFDQINIIRNNKVIEKLDPEGIKTTKRESDFDRYMYDERITAYVNLSDVRPGDIIDYSYVIKGYNPRNLGHYFGELYFEYNEPIQRLYSRLLVPDGLNLKFSYYGIKHEPAVRKMQSTTEYVWESSQVKALLFEDNTPSWYNPSRRVTITDFDSWGDLVDWILPDYTVTMEEKAKVSNQLSGIVTAKTTESRITEVIRFVQDHIRYLAFESGMSAYVPHKPLQVLSNRYGDCKDKSILLCTILQSMDIDAAPVFVNTSGLQYQKGLQPSIIYFNHCIIQINFKGSIYFIDPTISDQGGMFGSINVPDFGSGLVIKEGTNDLVTISGDAPGKQIITSIFKLDSIGGNAHLSVHTDYSDKQADETRSYFKSMSLEEINQNYVEFYSSTYPGIKTVSELKFNDDREKNIFTVDEEYEIENLWEPEQDEGSTICCAFYPLSIRSIINVSSVSKRTMPFRLVYPSDITEKIVINLPEPWNLHTDNFTVNDSAYYYYYSSSYADNSITLNYTFQSKKGYIEPQEVKGLIAGFNKILNEHSGLQITYDTAVSGPFRFSWFMGLLALIALLAGIFGAYKLYRCYNLPSKQESIMKYEIGGWLVLVIIGLILSFFVLIYQIFTSTVFFDIKTFDLIRSQKNTLDGILWSLIIIIELVYNVLMVIFIGLIILLFFKRRTILPRLIIILYAVNFSFQLIDTLLARQIPAIVADHSSYKSVIQGFVAACIWIPYFIHSKRVKNTFVVELIKVDKSSGNELHGNFHDIVSDSSDTTHRDVMETGTSTSEPGTSPE